MNLEANIQDTALRSIEAAELCPSPWPHLEVHDFLPWDFYAQLLAHWPGPDEAWKELIYPDQRKPDGTYRRKQLMLTEVAVLPELTSALKSDEVKKLFYSRLGLQSDIRSFPFPMLVDDEAGYWIRPHPDVTTKIITFQLFLPEDDHMLQAGTELLGAGVKQTLYLPNEGYAFHPAPNTTHQVRQGQCPDRRRSIMVIYYNSEKPNISYFQKR